MIDEIIEKQGWNESTVKDLLFRYIENQGSMDALAEFLERAAEEENAECEGVPKEASGQEIYVLSWAPSYDRGDGGGHEWRRTWEEIHAMLRDPEWMEPSSDYRVLTLVMPLWATDSDITEFLSSAYGNELIDPPDPRTDLDDLLYAWDINQIRRRSAMPSEEVYVLHIGDANYEISRVFRNGRAAEDAALAVVQQMWDEGGYKVEGGGPPRPTTYEEIEKWNEYWDGEADMLVKLHVAKVEG